jgi:hypothetical protein
MRIKTVWFHKLPIFIQILLFRWDWFAGKYEDLMFQELEELRPKADEQVFKRLSEHIKTYMSLNKLTIPTEPDCLDIPLPVDLYQHLILLGDNTPRKTANGPVVSLMINSQGGLTFIREEFDMETYKRLLLNDFDHFEKRN